MRLRKFFYIALWAFFIFKSPPLHAGFDLVSKGKAIAVDILTNPAGFLYDLHQLTESFVPTRVGRGFSIGTQVMPAFFPFTFANIHARMNILNEHPGIPQVEIFGGLSRMVALDYVGTDNVEGSIAGKHYGIGIVQSIHPKARVQLAYEQSTLIGKAVMKKNPIEISGTRLSSLTVDVTERFVLMGAELLRGDRRYLVTQMGYGLDTSRILARVILVGHRWDFGFTVYPEEPLVIYPVLGLRFGR